VARIVTGHADDTVAADNPPGLFVRRIVLTDVDAVAAGFGREVGTVVEKQRDVTALRDRSEDVAGPADGVVVHVLQAHLNARDIVRVEGGGQKR
jgi:hypothetical protein